jgi:hypothetical protein
MKPIRDEYLAIGTFIFSKEHKAIGKIQNGSMGDLVRVILQSGESRLTTWDKISPVTVSNILDYGIGGDRGRVPIPQVKNKKKVAVRRKK